MTALEVRLAGPADRARLLAADDELFDFLPREDQVDAFLADERHHLAIALDGDRIVGFASGVSYFHPDKRPELWINEVGVAETHHRRGLATRVCEVLLAHGRALGCGAAWVLTEHDNDAARALYKKLGGREQERPVYVTFALDDDDDDDDDDDA